MYGYLMYESVHIYVCCYMCVAICVLCKYYQGLKFAQCNLSSLINDALRSK